MKVTLVQSRGIVGDPKVNYFKAKMRIGNVESDIFVFPEMYCSGYVTDIGKVNFQTLKVLMLDPLSELSHNTGSTVICGCPVKNEDGTVTDSVLIVDGKKTYVYSKMNLRSDNVADETSIYTPGSSPMIISRGGLSFGIAAGHDICLSELCRYYAENGADMIVCCTALVDDGIRKLLDIAKARAMEFSIPILVCNMTGNDSGKEMGGLSALIGADGTFVESCTSGSDVREIRLDPEAVRAETSARKPAPKVELSECVTVEMETLEADPDAPKCPVFG